MFLDSVFPARVHAGTTVSLFILGSGILSPWCAWATASDYFIRLYGGMVSIERLFSIFYFLPNLIVLLFLAAFGDHYAEGLRVRSGFWGYIIGLLSVPLIDLLFIRGDKGNPFSLAVTLLAVILTGVADAVAQGSLFGTAARVEGGAHTQILMAGTAASGTLISILRIVTKAALPNTLGGLRASTAIYFIVAGLNCVACLVVYDRLIGQAAWRKAHNLTPATESESALLKATDAEPMVATDLSLTATPGPRPFSEDARDPGDLSSTTTTTLLPPTVEPLEVEAGRSPLENPSRIAPTSSASASASYVRAAGPPPFRPSPECLAIYQRGFRELVPMVRRLWKGCLGLVAVFLVTLNIFPGVLTEDQKGNKQMGDWFAIILICTFNVGDFAGKLMPSLPPYQYPKVDRLVGFALVRGLSIMLYKAAALRGWGILEMGILTLFFGGTNGWLATNLLMYAPGAAGLLPGTPESEVGGTVLICALMLGLTLGAFSSWLWLL